MPMEDALARYRSVQVQTAGRGQLLLLALDGIVQRLQATERALAAGDPAAARAPAWRAQALIMELLQSLDKGQGGDLAAGLESLYQWWLQQILRAVLHKDPALLTDVIEQVEGQRQAWAEAATQVR